VIFFGPIFSRGIASLSADRADNEVAPQTLIAAAMALGPAF
jgi:hypothetical protein